jgi:hypothetical protein
MTMAEQLHALGRAEGEALGRAEGEALGRAEGEALGRAEGEVKAKAGAILVVLDARGKSISAEQRARIQACSDHTALDRWLRRAATLDTVLELFEQGD